MSQRDFIKQVRTAAALPSAPMSGEEHAHAAVGSHLAELTWDALQSDQPESPDFLMLAVVLASSAKSETMRGFLREIQCRIVGGQA